MPNYRRAYVPGATYFFTVNLADRTQRLLAERVDLLRRAFAETRIAMPFRMDAVVVLPDHLHCIWTLPGSDADYSTRWQQVKTRFSRAVSQGELLSQSRKNKHERGIWQRRFWEHLVRDDVDLAAHVNYIHYNPVKHGHVKRVADWPYSSFHRFVRDAVYPVDWAGGDELQGSLGEPG